MAAGRYLQDREAMAKGSGPSVLMNHTLEASWSAPMAPATPSSCKTQTSARARTGVLREEEEEEGCAAPTTAGSQQAPFGASHPQELALA